MTTPNTVLPSPPIILWLLTFCSVFLWSGINAKDYYTWMLEVAPAVIALLIMTLTYRRFQMTTLVYCLVLIHSIILMVGGHYTYAEVPLFDGLFGMERNNYDKLGHLAQGFIPAMVARELLIRFNVVNGHYWRTLFILSFCLGFSAFYELIEWWVALLSGEGADEFLGTQGYIWDTQSDMALALIGAILALLSLSTIHNRQIKSLDSA